VKRVQQVWAHRTASEYRSATVAAEMLHWTLQLGLSPDTIRLIHRLVSDELEHAEACFQTYQAAGGSDPVTPVPDAWLCLSHEPERPLILRALAVAADEYAVAETVAFHVFKEIARHAVAPAVAPVVQRIVEDEARHSRFGWEAVEELLERTGDVGRTFLRERLPSYLQRVRDDYTRQAAPCTAEEVAWGLMDTDAYASITERALGRVEERMERLLRPSDP